MFSLTVTSDGTKAIDEPAVSAAVRTALGRQAKVFLRTIGRRGEALAQITCNPDRDFTPADYEKLWGALAPFFEGTLRVYKMDGTPAVTRRTSEARLEA